MLEISILGSGSGGNSAVVRGADTCLLIDAGLSCRQLRERMAAVGVAPEELDGVLLTHEHGDHTRGLDVFCRGGEVPVYCNPLTREALGQSLKQPKAWRLVETGAEFAVGGITVTTFSVPHDAVDPVGFLLQCGPWSLGFVSDIGFVTAMVRTRLQGAHLLFLEANYDDGLLQADTKRPWSTKQRIMSRHGHLSNAQAAECAGELCHAGLGRVILGHLSRDCNRADLAEASVRGALAAAGGGHVEVGCAAQEEPSPWFRVSPAEESVGLRLREEERSEPPGVVAGARGEEQERVFAGTSTAFEQLDLF